MKSAVKPADTPRRITLKVWGRTILIHLWMWLYLCFFVLILGPYLWVAGHTFDPKRSRARGWSARLYRHFLRTYCGPRRLIVDDFDWAAVGGPCIIVANHQSMLDIIMLLQLPVDGRCWVKAWPFRVPLLGWLLRLCGHMLVNDFNVLPDSADSMLTGNSFFLFPEGTRSRSGRVGRFRDGAFLLGVKTGRPIIPVALHGSHDCFPRGQMFVFDPRLRVQPLGILWPDATQERPHLALKRQARAMIAAALGQARDSTETPAEKIEV